MKAVRARQYVRGERGGGPNTASRLLYVRGIGFVEFGKVFGTVECCVPPLLCSECDRVLFNFTLRVAT